MQYSSSRIKLDSYFSLHPSLDIPLQSSLTDISTLIRSSLSHHSFSSPRFFYQQLDIMEEKFFNQKMQEVFESYVLSREEDLSIKGLLVFFVEQDEKVRVEYQEYDVSREKAKEYLRVVAKERVESMETGQTGKTKLLESCRSVKENMDILSKLPQEQLEPQIQLLEANVDADTDRLPSNSPSLSNIPPSKSLFSPRPLSTLLSLKRRLLSLFTLFSRLHYTNDTSLTFDQIQNHVTSFNLTVWMLFMRDFGFLKLVKKAEVVGIFKKYSEKQLMGFQLFEVAIGELWKRAWKGEGQGRQKEKEKQRQKGWMMLGIATEQSYHAKMKELGVPYLDQSKLISPSDSSDYGPRRILQDRSSNLNLKSNLKTISSINRTPSNIKNKPTDPFAKIHLENPIKVDMDEQDRLYLKQYRIGNKKNQYVVNYEQKRILDSSPSTGLLKRLDQRIKRYANL